MTAYAETSAVLRWLFNEPFGDQILTHLRKAARVTCSRLTLIEARRAIRRAVTEAKLREAEAAELFAILAQAAAHWSILEISRDVAGRSEESFPVEPVRTLDAIHLASALVLRQSLPDLVVVSTDRRVRENGPALGLDLLPLGPPHLTR